MKWYMKNVIVFKKYFTQSNHPQDFREYVNSLDENKLNWFYNQMKEPVEFIKDISYLQYEFQWIKENFEDLSKEIFIQAVFGIEDVIKDKWYTILYNRYEKDIQRLLEDWS